MKTTTGGTMTVAGREVDVSQHNDDRADMGDALLVLFHDRLLGTRLYIHTLARFAIVLAIVCGTYFAKYVVGITDLAVAPLLVLALLLGLYNIPVFIVARRYWDSEHVAPPHVLLTGLMHLTILIDFIFLTVLLWLVGGAKSPFKAFYIIHVILATILLSPRAAYAYAVIGYSMFAALVGGEWLGFIPVVMPVGAANSATPLDERYVVTVLVVQAILMSFTCFLVSGLTETLRAGEKRLGDANAELTRLSKMRRAFLHITLHDLKAPVDALTMLLHNLSSGAGGPLTEQQSHWVERCQLRSKELSAFLRDFQTLATLEDSSIEGQGESINVANLLRGVVDDNRELAEASMHTVTLEVDNSAGAVFGVERLIHEAVANLVTNAIKYTPHGGSIYVRGRNHGDYIRIEVEDNGIGISPKDQEKLFQEFVRLKPPQTTSGEVSGSGLGLSIVRRIAEMHHGRVNLRSERGRGSTFTIELPVPPEA